jgi:hypothetical protein
MWRPNWSHVMQHDARMRSLARVIYEVVYPSEDWAPVSFEEAERRGTVHYRQAVDAANRARLELQDVLALGGVRGSHPSGPPEVAWAILVLGGVALAVIRFVETRRRS